MSVLSDALDRLGKYNLNPFSADNVYGFTGVGGMAANWVRALRDIVTAYNGVATIGQQAQQAVTDSQQAASAAAGSADAASTANGAAQQAKAGSETARDKAQAWAESATAPGGAGTQSAKTWALYGQTVAVAWAEGAGEPGGAGSGTKSARGWAEYAQTIVASIAGGPVASVNGRTGAVTGVAESAVVMNRDPLPTDTTNAYGKPYPAGQSWLNSAGKTQWTLYGITGGVADWQPAGGGSASIGGASLATLLTFGAIQIPYLGK